MALGVYFDESVIISMLVQRTLYLEEISLRGSDFLKDEQNARFGSKRYAIQRYALLGTYRCR